MTSHPDQLQLGPENAQQRLVLLHGWGADADDLLDLGELLVNPETSVVALRAPEPHPYGSGRQWYDLQPIDWDALPAARSKLRARLLALAESVPLERTVLLGFSQGAAMALDVGTALPLAGIVACSGYPHQGRQAPPACPPVLLTHGRQDPVVPFMASEELLQQLQASGQSAQLLAFDGGHGIGESLFPELKRFITERIAPSQGLPE
ncbi:alpha/beta hydrolase [Synechococcus sp. CB0205]|uniref:alpha/beta hydrolase n=1 Tax=Synechococcus sp. CB0205 TaxID=232363 RepID=UPI00020028DF|nr:dienelactone hydrolase family protein [Synechococcus sp. CB0205]